MFKKKINIYRNEESISVLVYRKQPWLDWLKKTMDVERELSDLTPSTYTVYTHEFDDLKKALKPYWKLIFKEEMISPRNWPKMTEKTFYEWFDIKFTTNCFMGP